MGRKATVPVTDVTQQCDPHHGTRGRFGVEVAWGFLNAPWPGDIGLFRITNSV